MKSFLKKLESENFRLRFLNFSEINSWIALDNYTRIKSFIVDGAFEIACSKWYLMYIRIVEHLQQTNPLSYDWLLNLNPFYGGCAPFMDRYRSGYQKTSFGLYLRVPTAANDVVIAIKNMLRVYGFDTKDAYLVVELNPDSASYYSKDVVEQEQKELLDFLKATFVKADEYFQLATKAIEALNSSLQYFTTTSYNNLYLLGELDYDRYSKEAIDKQLSRSNNTFTRRELELSVSWLSYSRFLEGEYVSIKHKEYNGAFIIDGEKIIPVTFKTRFFSEEGTDDE